MVSSPWPLKHLALVSSHLSLLLAYLLCLTALSWNHWNLGQFNLLLLSLGAKPRLKIYIIGGRLGLRLHMGAMGLSSSTLVLVIPDATLMPLGYMRQGGV
jgi:hypothetical protein